MPEEEWGPWIEHDGKGCPCAGQYVNIRVAAGHDEYGIPSRYCHSPRPGNYSLWLYSSIPIEDWHLRVIRYRIRTHRAISELRSLIENLPASEKEPA